MPSEDFLGPVDLATLLTSLKGSVPASFAAYHSELNPGEDEALRAKYGPANFYQHMGTAIPQRNYRAPNPYAAQGKAVADMQDFRMRFPTPEMQKAVIESMNHYAGGGLRKSVQEMAEELLKKGVKTEDKPDLGRRSLLGMSGYKPPQEFPMDLAKQINEEVIKAGKAPQIVHNTTEVTPSGQKSILESLIQTPISRRQVVKSMASQAGQAMLPAPLIHEATSLLPKVIEPLSSLQSAAPVANKMSVFEMLPGLIAKGIDQGLSGSKLEDFVMENSGHPFDISHHIDSISQQMINPEIKGYHDFDIHHPSEVLQGIIDPYGAMSPESIYSLRPTLRHMKEQSPERYHETMNNARDISMGQIEDLHGSYDIDPKALKAWREGKIDSDEFGSMHSADDDEYLLE